MSFELYLAYILACVVFAVVPGPMVTLIISNSLTHGTRAGLANIAGAQLGLAIMIGIVLVGLASIIESMGWWFDWVRLAGAAYLVWIGVKLFRAPNALGDARKVPAPDRRRRVAGAGAGEVGFSPSFRGADEVREPGIHNHNHLGSITSAAAYGFRARCFASPRNDGETLCPFLALALLLHVGAQHRIHAALIARAVLLEEIEHVVIDSDRNRLFLRNDENGVRPVDIERNGVRIVADSLFDLLIRESIDLGPISLALPSFAPFSPDDTLVLHFFSRGAPR